MRWTLRPAGGARLAELPVHRHLRPEGGHLLGELLAGVPSQPLRPVEKRLFRRVVETGDLRVGEARRERDGRELRRVEDLVRVGVSDAGEEGRIRQGALQRVVLAPEARGKGLARRLERLEAAGIEGVERLASRDDPHPRPLLRARLGQKDRPGIEVEGKQADFLWNGGSRLAPSQSARNHEMKDEEEGSLRM